MKKRTNSGSSIADREETRQEFEEPPEGKPTMLRLGVDRYDFTVIGTWKP